MQIPKDTSENPNMHGIGVAGLSEDRDQLAVLQHRLERTNLGRTVFSRIGFPVGPTHPILRQIQDQRAEVVFVDIDPENPQGAISASDLIHASPNEINIAAL